jgi:flagellar biosynthesis protein FlhG
MQIEKRKTSGTTRGPSPVTRVISFASGKGGVGKSTLVLNVAVALAEQGRSVLLLDADLGLANLDVLLGLRPKATLHDVIRGTHHIRDVVLPGPSGISIIPAASGVEEILQLSAQERQFLLDAIEQQAGNYEYLLIDTGAGIGEQVLWFAGASAEVVCVVTPEPTSLTDAYALIKVLSKRYGQRSISAIVNMAQQTVPGDLSSSAERTFYRLARAVDRFLHTELSYLGFVPEDSAVRDAVCAQQALLREFPSSAAARAVRKVADTIEREFSGQKVRGGMQFFFQQLLDVGAHGS